MKARILKQMTVNGEILLPSTVVDVSGWRTANSLKNNRYIEFIEDAVEIKEEIKKPKQQKDLVNK